MDALSAARAQMTVSLAFHMVFAAIGIALPLLMVIAEGLHLRTGHAHHLSLAKKWSKATGLLFAVGAVSGTALSFELGLLWPAYMEIAGAAVGHLFALEGYAFFVEAIFIGLYLYGWDRLSPRAHWWCGVVVAVSGALSGVLVLGVNAWMQVPVGWTRDAAGAVVVTDPLAIYKQYGWAVMAVHSTLACYAAVAFAVAGVYAAGLLRHTSPERKRRVSFFVRRKTPVACARGSFPEARSAIRISLTVGAIAALLQPVAGDLLAKFVYRTQPAKFAAMEGQFRTETFAPARLGGWPDTHALQTRYALEIPGALSFLAAHDVNAEVTGLEDIPRDLWPNVHLTHLSFQVMVGCGTALIAAGLAFWVAVWRRRDAAFRSRALLRVLVLASPLGFIALEAGWITTEVGRQPWVIQGVLRTADAVTADPSIDETFYAFTALYLLLATAVVVLLLRLRDRMPTPI